MDRAVAFEDSGKYGQAAQEYKIVAEQYPSTTYYQTAVWKSAFLNIHPAISEINYSAALHWLEIYIKLPLSAEEKERAELHIAMLERINRLKADLFHLIKENKRLVKVTRKQSGDIAANIQRLSNLESELAKASDELNKMKEVDVLLHRSRVSRDSTKALPLGQKPSKFNPEVDSSDMITVEFAETGELGESTTPRKGVPSLQDEERTQYLSDENTTPKRSALYPYTIQISSYQQKEESIRIATESRKIGDLGFNSHAPIPGIREWYHVFVGYYRTVEEARNAVFELKKRKYLNAFAVKMPYAIEIGISFSYEEQKMIEADILSKGYLAYSVPDKPPKNKTRILIGAFWTEKEADRIAKKLQKKDLKLKVILR